jgi:hypothetical protein
MRVPRQFVFQHYVRYLICRLKPLPSVFELPARFSRQFQYHPTYQTHAARIVVFDCSYNVYFCLPSSSHAWRDTNDRRSRATRNRPNRSVPSAQTEFRFVTQVEPSVVTSETRLGAHVTPSSVMKAVLPRRIGRDPLCSLARSSLSSFRLRRPIKYGYVADQKNGTR